MKLIFSIPISPIKFPVCLYVPVHQMQIIFSIEYFYLFQNVYFRMFFLKTFYFVLNQFLFLNSEYFFLRTSSFVLGTLHFVMFHNTFSFVLRTFHFCSRNNLYFFSVSFVQNNFSMEYFYMFQNNFKIQQYFCIHIGIHI